MVVKNETGRLIQIKWVCSHMSQLGEAVLASVPYSQQSLQTVDFRIFQMKGVCSNYLFWKE